MGLGEECGQELTLLSTSTWALTSLHKSSTNGWTGTEVNETEKRITQR